MKKLLPALLLFIFLSGNLFSGGFMINDQSARSVAMGISTIANISDPSAVFYNPAAMGWVPGDLAISAGLCYIMPGAKFTGITSLNQNYTYSTESWNFPIPNFYAIWRTPLEGLSIGAGVFVPFGLGTRWPDDWPGKHSALETYLQTIEINPNISYRFTIGEIPFGISAGFGYVLSEVEMSQAISTFNPEPILHLKGDGTGTSYNFGIYAEPIEGMKFGASYRHNIEIDYDGDVTYDNIDGLESLFVPGGGSTSINYPNDLRVGLAYRVAEGFWLEAGIQYVGWSSYDTLSITFEKMPGNPTTSYTTSKPRLYQNSTTFRLGAEYMLNAEIFLRCGFLYDPMPVESDNIEPVLPEGDRLGGSLGIGMKMSDSFSMDLSYLGIYGMQTEVENNPNGFNGIYNTWANVFALSLSYHLN